MAQQTIKIGALNPYSGPLSAYGTIGKAIEAYWKMVNDNGGINGRRINFITYDDGFVPPKTVEMVRKLVEDDKVFAIFQLLGTPTNTVVQKYLNQKKVPQLFVATGASKWGDPKNFPWTMGWQPDYHTEGAIYAKHALAKHKDNLKDLRIGIIYQNDDSGKDYVGGFLAGLGKENEKYVTAKVSYEVTDPTIDSQLITLKATGADVLISGVTGKFGAMAIRRVSEIGWKVMHLVPSGVASVTSTIVPAGVERSIGVISSVYTKDPSDPAWAEDAAIKTYKAFMAKYYPEGNPNESYNAYGYMVAQVMQRVLEQCNGNFTRANIMAQVNNLRNLENQMLLPGIKVNTSPTNHHPLTQMQLMRWDGKLWQRFGNIIAGSNI